MIVYLRYSGNPRGAMQGHAKEEEYRGGGEETMWTEMEVEWEGATSRVSLSR